MGVSRAGSRLAGAGAPKSTVWCVCYTVPMARLSRRFLAGDALKRFFEDWIARRR